jgi:hypothetical protein
MVASEVAMAEVLRHGRTRSSDRFAIDQENLLGGGFDRVGERGGCHVEIRSCVPVGERSERAAKDADEGILCRGSVRRRAA